jgi:hypothetical protein
MSANAKTLLTIDRQGKRELLTLEEWESLSRTSFSTSLEFDRPSLREKVVQKTEKLYRKGELSRQQLWFGSYFKEEMDALFIPDVVIRYIDPIFGWGVFANRNFKKMEFIAEYSGLLRKVKRSDKENSYCFEYTFANGVKSPYTIDAQDKGGIGRLINHSRTPNLQSSLATVDFVSHVILITNQAIEKGSQLCYDYGPDYWSRRESPRQLIVS